MVEKPQQVILLENITSVSSLCFWLLFANSCLSSDTRSHCRESEKHIYSKYVDFWKYYIMISFVNLDELSDTFLVSETLLDFDMICIVYNVHL